MAFGMYPVLNSDAETIWEGNAINLAWVIDDILFWVQDAATEKYGIKRLSDFAEVDKDSLDEDSAEIYPELRIQYHDIAEGIKVVTTLIDMVKEDVKLSKLYEEAEQRDDPEESVEEPLFGIPDDQAQIALEELEHLQSYLTAAYPTVTKFYLNSGEW